MTRRLTLHEAATASGLSYGQVRRRVVLYQDVPSERDGQSYTIAAEDVALLKPRPPPKDPRPGITLRPSVKEMRAFQRTAGAGVSVSMWLLGLARRESGLDYGTPDASRQPYDGSRSLAWLDLSVAAENQLLRAGIRTCGELCKLSEAEVMQLEGGNRKALRNIVSALEVLGLRLADGKRRAKP